MSHSLKPAISEPAALRSRVRDLELLKHLWRITKPHWRILIVAVLLLPIASGLSLLPPFLLKLAIDNAIVPRELNRLWPYGAMLVGALVVQQAANFGHSTLIQWCGQRAMHDLRVKAHRHVLSLRVDYFDRTPLGVLIARVTNDVESISEAFASGLVAVIGDVVRIGAIIGMMLWLNRRLALLSFAVLPALIVVVTVFQRILRESHRIIRAKLAQINAYVQEHLGGMKVIQMFGQEAKVKEEFDQVNRSYREAYRRAIVGDASLFALVEMMGTLTIASLLWYGGFRMAAGGITFGLLVAFIEYVQDFFEPVRDISAKFAVMQQAMVSAERVFSLIEIDQFDAPASPLPIPVFDRPALFAESNGNGREQAANRHRAGGGEIIYRDVTFGYKQGDPLFNHLSLTISSGEHVAIVGSTGSGKTSLVRLLIRLYEVLGGAILLDGRDIRELPISLLRRQIVLLGQDPFIFAGTVADNISLGDELITREKATVAAEIVGLSKLLALDHTLTERGSNISAGERQLVALARAMARDPEVIVLDEATASVDPESERLVQVGTEELLRQRTALIIAHRLTTVENANRLIVMQRGKIIEEGNHASLIQRDGTYAHMYRLQYVRQSQQPAPIA